MIVIVKFDSGEKWLASFFTYSNIDTLVKKNKATGESLGGKYFCATDMILIDEVSRVRIKEVIDYMLNEGEFELFLHEIREFTDIIGTTSERYTEIREIVRELRKKEIIISTEKIIQLQELHKIQ